MKPLKQTTALSTIATSAFLYVPSMHTSLAFAEGASATSAATSPLAELTSVAPFAIAISSAVAVVSAVGIGMELYKRRQLEQERYMSWVSDNLTGVNSIDWSALSEHLDKQDESVSNPEEINPVCAKEQSTANKEIKEQSTNNLQPNYITDDSSSDTDKSQSINTFSEKITSSDKPCVTPSQTEEDANSKEFLSNSDKDNSTVNDLLSWDKNSHTTGSFRPEYTAGGTYIPRHAVKKDKEAVSNMSNNTFINNLESKYADILGDVRNPWREEPKHLANPVCAKIEMSVPLIDDPYKSSQVSGQAPNHTPVVSPKTAISQNKQPLNKPVIHETKKRSGMTSADKVASALANKKSLEDAATEIAKVGKISALASAATATALRNAGVHAVVRNSQDMRDHANDAVPIKRGPGFVDVNDNTFIRTDGKISKKLSSIPQMGTSASVSNVSNMSQYTLKDNLPVSDGRVLSCTDSISDFRCNIVSKTYCTQGDMVQVEYSQAQPSDKTGANLSVLHSGSNNRYRRESSRDKTISFASGIRPAVALASVPLI